MTIESNQEVILNDSVIYKQVSIDFLDNGAADRVKCDAMVG